MERSRHHPWLTLLRQRAFLRVTLVAALVLGSHAMHDSFAVIRWTQAGISVPLLLFVQYSVDKPPRCYVCDELSGELTDS
jgi:hypothetical protein